MNARRVDLNLQPHDVTAGGSSHQPGSNVLLLGVQLAHVARVLVVIDNLQKLVIRGADSFFYSAWQKTMKFKDVVNSVVWIRIRSNLHSFGSVDPDPEV